MDKQQEKALRGRDYFGIISLALSVLTILLFFVNFLAINNLTPGNEIVELPTNGFRFVAALLGNGFESAGDAFGDISFYYYHMKDSTTLIAVLTTLALAFVLLGILFSVLDLILDKTAFRYLAALSLLFSFFCLLACFIVCLVMLPKFMVKYKCNSYCHPICLAILPAIAALAATVLGFVHVAKRI